MDYFFKQITGQDIELLKALNRVFAEAFGESQTYLGSPPGDDYLRNLLKRENVYHFDIPV